jgi:hypothetical protein
MQKKIIILTIPGIGTQKEGYADKLKSGIEFYAEDTALDGNFEIIECRPFALTHIDENQIDMYNRMEETHDLGGILSLRKFVMQAFGDAVTFERNPTQPESVYRSIHHFLKETIEETNRILNTQENAILVVVCSSMGAHVLSSYIWDADHNQGIFENAHATHENNLENLRYLVTVGCNIPLFVSGYAESQIVPFKARNPLFEWDNYFDKNDVLGWPLQPLSSGYQSMVKDHEINTGLSVGSHVRYLGHKNFTKPFTEKLLKIMEN